MTAGRRDGADRIFIVAIDGSEDACEAVRECHGLANGCAASWQALHVETPESASQSAQDRVAEAFALATSLGATVATIPAVSIAEGLIAQIEEQGATDLVIRRSRSTRLFSLRRRAIDEISARCEAVRLHLLSRSKAQVRHVGHAHVRAAKANPRSYVVMLLLVLAALAAAVAVGHWFGTRGLDLFFLFPVITAAVKFGFRQSLMATILSVLFHNLFFIQPLFRLTPAAGQSILMAGGLAAVGLYTSMIAEQLRGRLRLSDRSAKESSAIVTFAQELARANNWDATARIVSQTFSAIMGTRSTMLREKDGEIVVVASEPAAPVFGLLDQVARD
jgi:two-component system sensor histidine kinase KdpD